MGAVGVAMVLAPLTSGSDYLSCVEVTQATSLVQPSNLVPSLTVLPRDKHTLHKSQCSLSLSFLICRTGLVIQSSVRCLCSNSCLHPPRPPPRMLPQKAETSRNYSWGCLWGWNLGGGPNNNAQRTGTIGLSVGPAVSANQIEAADQRAAGAGSCDPW
jgi:hypothetical protein